MQQCPPLPRDSADRGGAVGGGVLNGLELRIELHITVRFPVSQLSPEQSHEAALRIKLLDSITLSPSF